MAKDTVTVPLTFTKEEHARLAYMKAGMGLTWEEFFTRPYEKSAPKVAALGEKERS